MKGTWWNMKEQIERWCEAVTEERTSAVARERLCLELVEACSLPASPEQDAAVAATARKYMQAKADNLAATFGLEDARKACVEEWRLWSKEHAGK